jgi:hypothetical protein
VTYGFCLSPDADTAFITNPPDDFDTFVDAILVANGVDPALCDTRTRLWVSDCVREWIFDDGRGKGTKSGLPLVLP